MRFGAQLRYPGTHGIIDTRLEQNQCLSVRTRFRTPISLVSNHSASPSPKLYRAARIRYGALTADGIQVSSGHKAMMYPDDIENPPKRSLRKIQAGGIGGGRGLLNHSKRRCSWMSLLATTATLGLFIRYRSWLELYSSKRFLSKATIKHPPRLVPQCETRELPHKSIRSYLSEMDRPDHWVLFKWKADGSFDHDLSQPESLHPDWAPSPDILGDTQPSEFGRIALLLNSDQISFVPWDIAPPVPVWVFSKPKSSVDPRILNMTQEYPASCELKDVTAVPTPYDTGNFNKHCVESIARTVTTNFIAKFNQVVWRGSRHWPKEAEKSRAAALEFAELHAKEPWLNVKESKDGSDDDRLSMEEMAEYRYHLDLGGLSGTSWGGTRWKLCSGLLVFKVEAWADDWWHDSLEPWKHYIPVQANVSDLYERYQWTQDHPEEAMQIATTGRQKCLETLGLQKARKHYRSIVQNVPAADKALMDEADELLKQMVLLKSDLGGVVSQAASRND